MLFLGLLIYFLMLTPVYLFVLPLSPVIRSLPFALFVMIQFLVATLLGLFLTYLVDVYHPTAKGKIRNLVRSIGIRWICVLTMAAILVCICLEIFYFHATPTKLSMGFLIPALIVSGLNAIGAEIPLKRLEETPEPGKVILPEIPPAPEIKEEIVRNFQWKYKEKEYALSLVIRRSIYEAFRNRNRNPDTSKWAEEYVAGGITGEIRELGHQLYEIGIPYGTYQEVEFVLSFVQEAIQYQTEETEYPRFPVETLSDGMGDCEDFSILGAAILKCMGYEVGLMVLPGHAALGVAGATGLPGPYVEKDGLRYYYREMTADGWKIGQMPEEYEGKKMEVFPVPPLPVKVVRLGVAAASTPEKG
jgi:hypothetical protein